MIESNPSPETFVDSTSVEFIMVHSDYCANQRKMSKTLEENRKSHQFCSTLEVAEKNPENNLTLEAHLLNPIRRIVEYTQLLKT